MSDFISAMDELITATGVSKEELPVIRDGILRLAASQSCRVYWGSHGCHQPGGHPPEVPHECDCCRCGEHHPYPDWPDTNVLCVAKPPYYGPETRFYGEDAEALGLPLITAED